jgi:hypothetical protein
MTVEAAAERVWHVLTSFEKMSGHLSGLKRSRILQKEGKHRLVEQTATVRIALFPLTLKLVMDVVEAKPFLYFNQRFGSFSSFRGHWRIDHGSGDNGTRIHYYLEARLGRRWKRVPFEHHLHRMIRQNLQELSAWIDNGEI